MATCAGNYSYAEGALAPHQLERVEQIKRVMQLEIALAELRDGSETQGAEEFETSHPKIGRIEKEIDVVQLSTFQRYVEMLGAKLEIRAIFDDVDITDIILSG